MIKYVVIYRHSKERETPERKEINIMSNQEIFEALAENECKLFYAWCADSHNEELRAAHLAARTALETFAKATGCHN